MNRLDGRAHRKPRWFTWAGCALILWGLFLSPLCAYLCEAAERKPASVPSCHQVKAAEHGRGGHADSEAPCGSILCERLQPLNSSESDTEVVPPAASPAPLAAPQNAGTNLKVPDRWQGDASAPPGSIGPPIPLPLRQILRT